MDIVILKSPQITKEDREDKKLSQWMRQQADKWHKKNMQNPSSVKETVIFEEHRGMEGFEVQSRFNEKVNTTTTFVYSTGANKREFFW